MGLHGSIGITLERGPALRITLRQWIFHPTMVR